MPCEQLKTQLYLYLDGELAAPETVEVEHHLHTCMTCQQEATAHHRLQTLLRTALPQEEVPDHLWASIRRQLPGQLPEAAGGARWFTQKRLGGRLVVLAAVLLLLLFGMREWFAAMAPPVVREIVDSQIRARLMQAPYKQLAADAGAIRQWFHERVEFAVLVPDMPREQYDFLGVRLNYFLDRRVAEMAYASHSHVLSFMMFANDHITLHKSLRTIHAGDRVFYVQKYKGYNTVLWQDQEFFCSLVSDLQLTALLQIARAVTGSSPVS